MIFKATNYVHPTYLEGWVILAIEEEPEVQRRYGIVRHGVRCLGWIDEGTGFQMLEI